MYNEQQQTTTEPYYNNKKNTKLAYNFSQHLHSFLQNAASLLVSTVTVQHNCNCETASPQDQHGTHKIKSCQLASQQLHQIRS